MNDDDLRRYAELVAWVGKEKADELWRMEFGE